MFDARKLLDSILAAGSQATAGGAGAGQGGAGGLVGGVLGQLGQGMQQAGQAAGGALDQAQDRLAGTQAGDALARARKLAADNPAMAGAVLGGLATLLLGSRTGRAVTGSAVKLGGLALIGGLAYRAFQNYQAGKPLLQGSDAGADTPELAPPGSGFEPAQASNETALLFIRAMIAAAAADGTIDETERRAITAGLTQAGVEAEAGAWLAGEMARPASIDELAAGATTPELAAQVYTAARLAIEPDTPAERDFLAGLAGSLGLDAELVANIDIAAEGVKS